MMHSIFRTTIIAFASLAGLAACVHKSDLSSAPQISFSQQVQPIIVSNCAMSGCHITVAGQGGGEEELFPLTTYDEVVKHVTPGDARKSKIYRAITSLGGEDKMPPDGRTLSEEATLMIYLWIEQGARNN